MISKETKYTLFSLAATSLVFFLIGTNMDFFKKHTTLNATSITGSSITTTQSKEEKIKKKIKKIKKMEATSIVKVGSFSNKQLKKLFYSQKISDSIFEQMEGKSYKSNCTVPKSSLRYVRVLYYGFDKKTHVGELVVNKSIAKDIKTIFYKLYKHKYPIEKMVLVDEYDADDNLSMEDNNTSSFNFRLVEGTTHLSKHSLGLAIDINPRYNPYIHTLNGKTVCSPENGSDYADRSKDFPYKITTSDYAYKLFIKHGFTWGGAWNSVKDYQHFQKSQ